MHGVPIERKYSALTYDADPAASNSAFASLLAFFASALEFTFAPPKSWIALPRLTEREPVILACRSLNGIPRFLETCKAATHWPKFLNSEHADWRLPPGTVTPLFPSAVVSEESSLVFVLNTALGDWEPRLAG